jgi:hypothetical protein
MQKISAWMFLLLAVLMLLPMVGVDALGSIGGWLMVVAYAVVGFMELKG